MEEVLRLYLELLGWFRLLTFYCKGPRHINSFIWTGTMSIKKIKD